MRARAHTQREGEGEGERERERERADTCGCAHKSHTPLTDDDAASVKARKRDRKTREAKGAAATVSGTPTLGEEAVEETASVSVVTTKTLQF